MNKVLVITGASRGIGAATARIASAQGYAVCVNYHTNQTAADGVVSEIRESGGIAVAIQADISVESDVVRLFEGVDDELGLLCGLVNNAGILAHKTTVAEMRAERIERLFAINVTGSFLCVPEAVQRMSTARGGSGGGIVNLSSAASRLGSPGEFVDYAASKGAIDSMTIGLAKEVASEGIRVNCVRPGLIDTDMHADGGDAGRPARLKDSVPMKRVGGPAEIAGAILWLLSEEASYTTGAIVDVAGGR